jgi:hypothetical protein
MRDARCDAGPAPGECVRIMTGGVMPAGCDSVIPQELWPPSATQRSSSRRHVIRTGDNRRFAGEDLKAGSAALAPGKHHPPGRPGPGGLARHRRSAGAAPPARGLLLDRRRTALDRRALDAGCVYDSNRYTLYGMLHAPGLRHHRHGHRARRPGRAGRSAAQRLRKRRRHRHLGRRVGRRGRLHAQIMAAWATSRSGRSACGPAARWPSAASPRNGTAPSCSACRAIRWR